jgi:hypothetical protein
VSYLPHPTVSCSAFARNHTAAVLVCAKNITTDGSLSKPFLYVVGLPTVYPLGQTRTSIWKHAHGPWSAASLPPDNIQGPISAAHVVMGTVHPSLRSHVSVTNHRYPPAYLSQGTTLCFSDSGCFFSPVIAPATSAPASQPSSFNEQQTYLESVLWPPISLLPVRTYSTLTGLIKLCAQI